MADVPPAPSCRRPCNGRERLSLAALAPMWNGGVDHDPTGTVSTVGARVQGSPRTPCGAPPVGVEEGMAQQVNVKFVDDLDGSDAAGTVSFGIDGRAYEIDEM